MDRLDKEIEKLNTLTRSLSLSADFNEKVMKAISNIDLNAHKKKAEISKGKIWRLLMEIGKSERLFDDNAPLMKADIKRIFHDLGINVPIKELKEALLEIKAGPSEETELSYESLAAVVGGSGKFDAADLLKIRDRTVQLLEEMRDMGKN